MVKVPAPRAVIRLASTTVAKADTVPAARPVSNPSAVIDALSESFTAHSVRIAGLGVLVAVSLIVSPTAREMLSGVTVTPLTPKLGGEGGGMSATGSAVEHASAKRADAVVPLATTRRIERMTNGSSRAAAVR